LTHAYFLSLYKKILKPMGKIYFKTDNKDLFEYSLNSFCENNFKLKNISLDLYNKNKLDIIKTEYEEKFLSLGYNIYYLEAVNIK
jgi:tRNA (guanine-N7-)-methyltransferase